MLQQVHNKGARIQGDHRGTSGTDARSLDSVQVTREKLIELSNINGKLTWAENPGAEKERVGGIKIR